MTTILGAPREWLESDPTRWYIVFCNASRLGWWDAVFRTRPGFQHAYALRWDGYNWLLFNPGMAYTDIAIMPGLSENALKYLIEPGDTVVEVEAFRKPGRVRRRWWAGPMTCVEQVKALLGLKTSRVWTPWQLYEYLMEAETDGNFFRQKGSQGHNRNIQKAKVAEAYCSRSRPGKAPAFRSRRIDPG